MKVTICDDERVAIEYLAELLQKQKEIEIIGEFTNQKELLDNLARGNTPDVVFMDIDWKNELNGIMLSKLLFQRCPHTQIIYVTGYNDRFSQQIFLEDSNLCGYLVKPVQEELLAAMLKRAQERKKPTEEKFILSQRGVVRALPYEEIYCLESKGHHVIVHTANETFGIYEKLDACIEKLPRQFARCHKSYVVNMDKIVFIDKSVVWLKGDKKVTISKTRYQEFREQYFRYMGKKM